MIDSTYPGTSVFLWVVGLAFLLAAGVPLLVMPDRWGRAFGWRTDTPDPYRVYLGRCLGAVASVISVAALWSAPAPGMHRESLQILLAACAGLFVVHLYGAIRGGQPWQENAETGLYAGLLLLGGWLYMGLGG